MSSDIKVKLFQSVVFQKNEDYLLRYDLTRIQANAEGKFDFSEDHKKFLGELKAIIQEPDFMDNDRKREEAITKGLGDPFNNLSVDIQFKLYVDGNNEWHCPIQEKDIIKIVFDACPSHQAQVRNRPIFSILLLHKVPAP